MRLLIVDDDPANIESLARILRDSFDPGFEVQLANTVERAVEILHAPSTRGGVDIVVTDLFIPLGTALRETLGPRARKYAEDIEHLGGLVLLDEIDRVDPAPLVIAHTACTDPVLTSMLGERVHARIPKPAPFEVLLRAITTLVHERDQAKKWQ
jgi:CheY-like chemotaxis protein